MKTKFLYVLLCALPLQAQYYLGTNLTTTSPTVVQFAWDLDDVAFKKRKGLIGLKALKHLGKLAKLKLSRKKKFKKLRHELNHLSGASAEVLQQVLKKHGEGKLAAAFGELASQVKRLGSKLPSFKSL